MATNVEHADKAGVFLRRAVDERVAAATAVGKARLLKGELAKSVDYDPQSRRLRIELRSGVGVDIPVAKLQGLAGSTEAVIRNVRIDGGGYGLHWPVLDLDLAVPDLIAGCFGSRAWMSALGRQGGHVATEAKRRAARENGKKGGRPPKKDPEADLMAAIFGKSSRRR